MTQLWPWQQGAVEFMTAPERRHGGVLNMGMGTGKSLCAIEIARQKGARRILIVGPKAVVSENAWGKQFRQHGGGAFTWELLNGSGSSARKAAKAQTCLMRAEAAGRTGVNVINYESMWAKGFATHALTAGYDFVVYDECHRIKAPRSKVSLFAHRLSKLTRERGGMTIGLTGTFMPHSPLDAWAQIRAIDPTLFGPSFVRFRTQYAVMGGFENRQVLRFKNLDAMQRMLAGYVYKVTDRVLQFDDPLVSTVTVNLPRAAMTAYKQMEDDLVADLECGRVTAANGLVKLLRLQQFTSGYVRLDGSEDTSELHTAKRDALVDVFEGTFEEPIVVFGQFRGDIDTVRAAANEMGRDVYELSGQANDLETWDALARGGAQPGPVLAVQIASGGTGIDLTAAGVAVYLSTGFNRGNFEQSLARINRPGRKPIVRFIHVEAEGTIDQRVRRVLRQRGDLVENLLGALTTEATTT